MYYENMIEIGRNMTCLVLFQNWRVARRWNRGDESDLFLQILQTTHPQKSHSQQGSDFVYEEKINFWDTSNSEFENNRVNGEFIACYVQLIKRAMWPWTLKVHTDTLNSQPMYVII